MSAPSYRKGATKAAIVEYEGGPAEVVNGRSRARARVSATTTMLEVRHMLLEGGGEAAQVLRDVIATGEPSEQANAARVLLGTLASWPKDEITETAAGDMAPEERARRLEAVCSVPEVAAWLDARALRLGWTPPARVVETDGVETEESEDDE
jgi:hypothetical protein